MRIFRFAIAPALALLTAMPAAAEKIPLNAISNYFNGLKTVVADFSQVNADGSTSEGKLYIHRPGRVRFEYGGKNKTLVLASGGQVAVFDPKSNTGHKEYPLSKTPLSIILAPTVDLARANMVTGYSETQQGMTVVQAQDPAHPEYGNIQMVFSANPVQLQQWVVTDDTGRKTTVVLRKMQTGMSLPPSTFAIPSEVNRRK